MVDDKVKFKEFQNLYFLASENSPAFFPKITA